MKLTRYGLSLEAWKPMMALLRLGHRSRPVRYYLWQKHFEELGQSEVADAIREIILATKSQPYDGILKRSVDFRHLKT